MPRVIPSKEEIEVYATEHGHVAIRQRDPFGNEPTAVLLDPRDVPLMIRWLGECATDAEEIRQVCEREAVGEQLVPE